MFCLQFGGQAPGTSQEEREWAWRKFGFEFDVFDKIEVSPPNQRLVSEAGLRPQSLPNAPCPELPTMPRKLPMAGSRCLPA